MKNGNYSLTIVGGEEQKIDGYTYVNMRHGNRYKLFMSNMSHLPCDASVKIDGKHVGTWRIYGQRPILIERPVNDDGLFTFFRLGARAAYLSEIPDNENTGLIEVTYTPEKPFRPLVSHVSVPISHKAYRSDSRSGAGGTGMTGKSEQEFGSAAHIDLDHGNKVVLALRLVELREPVEQPRPMRATVPPRIG